MFVQTGKKFIESFSETKNQNSVVFVIQNCSLWCFVSKAFYRFGLSWLVFEIRTILWTSVFVNMSSNSRARGYCRFTLKWILLTIKFPFRWCIVCWGQFRSSKMIGGGDGGGVCVCGGGGGGGAPRTTSFSYSAKLCLLTQENSASCVKFRNGENAFIVFVFSVLEVEKSWTNSMRISHELLVNGTERI